VPDHVLADAGLTDVDAEFEQFPVNTRCAPQRVLTAESADQFADLVGDCASADSAGTNLPVPEQAEGMAMPAEDRGRLHEG
jgi:hypothetical protein